MTSTKYRHRASCSLCATLFVSSPGVSIYNSLNSVKFHPHGFTTARSSHISNRQQNSFTGERFNLKKNTRLQIHHHQFSSKRTRISCSVSNDTIKVSQQNGTDNSFSAAASKTTVAFNGKLARNSLHALMNYIRELSREQPFIGSRLCLAVFCMILSKLVGITVPFCLKRVIDTLMSHSATITSGAVPPLGLLQIALYAVLLHGFAKILTSVAHELRGSIFSRAGQRIGRSVTATSFAHIHSLEVAFHNNSQTGALTRIVDRGTRSVMTIFRGLIFSFLPTIFELILVCAVMFRTFTPWYAMVTIATFAAYVWWTLYINDRLGQLRAEMNLVENEASSKLTDSLINVEAVKAFDNGSFELQRYDESLWRYENVATRNEWLYASLNIGQASIFTVGLTVMLLRAAMGVISGNLTVGSVVMLSSMLSQLWVPLSFLGWQYREVKQSLIDMQNLFEILKRESKIQDAENAKPLKLNGGEIQFQNVSFSYPKSDDSLRYDTLGEDDPIDEEKIEALRQIALRNLSFHVPAGSSLALVGSSGSGKSTVTRLLYRLYDLTQGRILIDNQDISKSTLASLRQADTALFNDTIAYNIRYGYPSASDEEVIEAAKMASIHAVIMRLPDGYNTIVGERGVRFSGGERQRLSVARAFLKGSRIIIEDESTSALDTLTEMEVSKALRRLGIQRTRIIVAHRLSTIIDVDKIIVMGHGEKVEEGTFHQLISKEGGIFKEMWERQQERRLDEFGELDVLSEQYQ